MQERIIANSIISECWFDGTPCWDWVGKVGGGRFGCKYLHINIYQKGRTVTKKAHRVSYEAFTGDELGDNECNHRCERTTCVAPLHLESVTHAQNIAYRERKAA